MGRTAALVVIALLLSACGGKDEGTEGVVRFAGYGGQYQENIHKALLAPAAAKLNVALREDSHDALPAVRLQVHSGRPAWDLVQLGASECARGEREGLFEPLDYSQIDASGLPADAKSKTWVGTNYYSVVLAWRSDKFGAHPPQNWADFWNTKAFPGRRALSVLGNEMLELALLADGVPRDKLYPLDVDRAIRSVEKIKPAINVWWVSGAQSAQLLRDGEIDLMAIYSSRVQPLIDDKAPVGFTYSDGLLSVACMAIPKGAKNAKLANKMLGLIVSPEVQKNIPVYLKYYGPANEKVFAQAGADPALVARTNTSPENIAKQTPLDARWWAEHGVEAEERYRAVVSR